MNRFEPKMRELHAVPLGFSEGKTALRLTESQIQEAENILGTRLPDDYREFLRDFGAFSLNAKFPIREGYLSKSQGGTGAGIGYFFGIVEDIKSKVFDLLSANTQKDSQWFPEDSIVIGYDGNIPIFLYLRGERKNKIYIRDYEELCLVADSFTEFMQLLENEFQFPEPDAEAMAEDAAPFWASFSTE